MEMETGDADNAPKKPPHSLGRHGEEAGTRPGHVEVTEFISPAATWNLFGALILISAITDLCGSTSPSNETIQLPDVKSITSALS